MATLPFMQFCSSHSTRPLLAFRILCIPIISALPNMKRFSAAAFLVLVGSVALAQDASLLRLRGSTSSIETDEHSIKSYNLGDKHEAGGGTACKVLGESCKTPFSTCCNNNCDGPKGNKVCVGKDNGKCCNEDSDCYSGFCRHSREIHLEDMCSLVSKICCSSPDPYGPCFLHLED